MISIGATSFYNVTHGTAPIALIMLKCVGTECRMSDCPRERFGREYCHHTKEVGKRVRCVSTHPRPGVS